MMKKLILLISFLTALSLPAASLALVSVEGAAGVWYTMPSGDFSYKAGGATLTDFEDTFGFEEEISPMARVKLEVPVIPIIYFMYTPIKFEGDSKTDFTFDGQIFNPDAETELVMDQYDLAFFYNVPFLGLASLGKVHVNIGLNFRLIDLDATMTESGGGISRNESLAMPVPMLYLAADVSPTDLLVFEAEVRALPVSDYSVISAIGRVKVDTFGPVYVAAGYRYESMEVDHDDYDFKLDLSGPFAEVGFDF